jgi:hypothetical protein
LLPFSAALPADFRRFAWLRGQRCLIAADISDEPPSRYLRRRRLHDFLRRFRLAAFSSLADFASFRLSTASFSLMLRRCRQICFCFLSQRPVRGFHYFHVRYTAAAAVFAAATPIVISFIFFDCYGCRAFAGATAITALPPLAAAARCDYCMAYADSRRPSPLAIF